MELTQRRYLEGFFSGVQARGCGPSVAVNGVVRSPMVPDLNPWRVLLACAENDRPPTAGERGSLTALGVVDLGPEGRDGCCLRLRAAPGGRLRGWQLRELAAVSQAAAGGFIAIGGSGGGAELSVVGWRDAAGALARLGAVGLAAAGRGGVWCSPAAGLDAGEGFDVTTLAGTLDAALGAGGMRVGLDGGSRGWVAEADELTLRTAGGAVFAVTAGGMRFGVPASAAASAVVILAGMFRENGGWDGMKVEEVREALGGSLPGVPEGDAPPGGELLPGAFPQKQPGLCALVAAGPGDGLWRSRALLALAGLTEEIGAGEARLWRGGVLVPGVAAAGAEMGLARLAEIVAVVR